MPELQQPDKHSMDIPHVAAIDLPLNVHNVTRAVDMLGGEELIRASIRESHPLELRLRKDPFHHPIQALSNNSERILVKIKIPKKSLPKNNESYSIQELLELNNQDKLTPRERIQPVAIIDKTYLFKAMADFQVSTRNNSFVQKFNKAMINHTGINEIKEYIDEHKGWQGYVNLSENYFQNNDHQLIPPPILSSIRFPFDYKYQQNPGTSTVRDIHGEVKVISNQNRQKLYTLLIDYNTPTPQEPVEEIRKNWEKLSNANLSVNSSELLLVQCIRKLQALFEIKPIWNRKQLYSILPEDMKKFLKHALPYVAYTYKSGPWRFCNIKYGLDVVHDPSYWSSQTEYFRVLGFKKGTTTDDSKMIVPPSLQGSSEVVEIPENLLFNGVSLPSVATFQIGDIMDADIISIIQDHQSRMGEDFLRNVCDPQDGWINRQTMEVIRRIMRYKLKQLVNEESIDQSKIQKIINTNYIEDKEDEEEANDMHQDRNGPDELDEDDEEEEEEETALY